MVSIHAPTRGATSQLPVLNPNQNVSIHAPTRGATAPPRGSQTSGMFQSTHPRGVRPNAVIMYLAKIGFNPRTHEGCDKNCENVILGCLVSIHAPTRGATLFDKLSKSFPYVSIHAPTRGATVSMSIIFAFLSVSIHAPTRGATKGLSFSLPSGKVSIHAPTRGATFPPSYVYISNRCFNPRTHEGCDCISLYFWRATAVSIHAPTRGAT